jgi:hypothetical protein
MLKMLSICASSDFANLFNFESTCENAASSDIVCASSACFSLALCCNESKKLNTNCPSSQHGTSLCWLHAADITALVAWKFRHPLPFHCNERAASATSCGSKCCAKLHTFSISFCIFYFCVFYTCMQTRSSHSGVTSHTHPPLHHESVCGNFAHENRDQHEKIPATQRITIIKCMKSKNATSQKRLPKK